MESEARYTLVGAAVLVGTLLLVAGLVWLVGGGDKHENRHYTIYFSQQSMDGLDVSSAVKMRGIKVGVIDHYEFAGGGKDAVRMDIKVDEATPIRSNAVALVKRNFVTGLATIEIRNPDATSPLLTQVRPDERYPVIAEGNSNLDNVTNAVSQMAENGAQVLDKVNLLLSDANRKDVSDTIHNLQIISTNLADNKQALNQAVQSIQDAAEEFRFAGAPCAWRGSGWRLPACRNPPRPKCPVNCRAECASGLRWHGRWHWIRKYCFLMNPLQGWIRFRRVLLTS